MSIDITELLETLKRTQSPKPEKSAGDERKRGGNMALKNPLAQFEDGIFGPGGMHPQR